MKIEWASNFTPDGHRRNPPPSTIHGWLAKWRGTLTGNENVRSRGMQEMRRATLHRRARRKYEKKKGEGRWIASFVSRFFKAPKSVRNGSRHSTRSRTQSRRSLKSPRTRHRPLPTTRRAQALHRPRRSR